jgi:hypothetical protein
MTSKDKMVMLLIGLLFLYLILEFVSLIMGHDLRGKSSSSIILFLLGGITGYIGGTKHSE